MKKILALAMAAAISVFSFAGCGSPAASSSSAAPSSAPASSAPASSAAASQPAASGVKTGLGVVSSVAESTPLKDGKASAVADVTAVAVTVGQDGKIVKCSIDGVRAAIPFSDKGKLLVPATTAFQSKNELKEGYGVKKVSKIGKEWNEQAAAFAKYVVGKTADEVKGIAVNNQGQTTAPELTASVTIHVGDFITAVQKAVANAQDLGAGADDKLGLGVETTAASSADAGDKDGVAMAYSYFTASTFAADGKITSCVIDAAQDKVTFDKTGKITSDVKAEQKSKNELGDAYGMKKASKIGKEWNEQAAAFAKYVTGKTADQVKGIAVSKEGKATDAELTASVTVHVTDFVTILDKAAANAQ